MGLIDETSFTLSCPKCRTSESHKVLDKGSRWGGPHWQSAVAFEHFHVQWKGGGKEEPIIVSASCRSCGTTVQ